VHPAFSGSEQLKCADCALANPGRQIRFFDYRDQISDMPVSAVPCSMIVMVHVLVMALLCRLVCKGGTVEYFRWLLTRAIG
jgi:hypothetical protein